MNNTTSSWSSSIRVRRKLKFNSKQQLQNEAPKPPQSKSTSFLTSLRTTIKEPAKRENHKPTTNTSSHKRFRTPSTNPPISHQPPKKKNKLKERLNTASRHLRQTKFHTDESTRSTSNNRFFYIPQETEEEEMERKKREKGVEKRRKNLPVVPQFMPLSANHADDDICSFSSSPSSTPPASPQREPGVDDFILSRDPLVFIPAFLNEKLKQYQRIGVKFMYTLYAKNRGGILADDMGLGKTIQAIAFIAVISLSFFFFFFCLIFVER